MYIVTARFRHYFIAELVEQCGRECLVGPVSLKKIDKLTRTSFALQIEKYQTIESR